MCLEIKNVSLFFVGLIILIVGIFIIIFDYPQIQYFENLQTDPHVLIEEENNNIYQRLKIEFLIGFLLTAIGISILIFSFVQKPNSRN